MRRTPLHDTHVALGAKMVDYAGWRMPVQYGPILDEVRCVRERVGLFDLSHMGRFEVVGPDAVALVDRVATNHCAKIPVGAIRYSLLCREDGYPLDDLLVYRGERDVFLVVNAANAATDLAWLRSHGAGLDAEVVDRTDELCMLALQGARSAAVLQPCLEGLDLKSIKYYRNAFGALCGLPDVRVSRTGYTGEDGFEVYFPAAHAERVWAALMESGQEHGLLPIGLGARDTLRLEAGMPLYGHEIDLEHDPISAGLGFGISFDEAKGDWVGRAALERLAARPTHKLMGFTTDGKRVPRQGYPLVRDGAEVARVLSGAVSPTLDTNIGTASVPLDLARPGEVLDMDVRGKLQPCALRELPFYSRTRK